MKFLEKYPFEKMDPNIEIIQGFSVYDQVLGDKQGEPHNGIDYIWKNNDGILSSFRVFSAHVGKAFQGKSDSWGNFVRIQKGNFLTIYAHLKDIPREIPVFSKEKKNQDGRIVKAGEFIGIAGTSGDTKGYIQLHFEILEKRNDKWEKLDPYRINDRASSGKYPQPGESLSGLDHFWIIDDPEFV